MGLIIEQGGADEPVAIGSSGAFVSVKTYQDVYHQITGRTEQLHQRYLDDLMIDFSEVDQLNHKILQLCDVHKIVARNEVINVFHERERTETFTSFDRFKMYNANAASPTLSILLKYNFSVIPAGLNKPQEYVVSVRLVSRLATYKKLDSLSPQEMFANMSLFGHETVDLKIDYVDYVIARGFVEAVDEWVRGCRKSKKSTELKFFQKYSHLFPRLGTPLIVLIIVWFALRNLPATPPIDDQPRFWAGFLVLYIGALGLISNLATIAFRQIELLVDGFGPASYINLNKGDSQLVQDEAQRKKKRLTMFFLNTIWVIILGVVSAKLTSFFPSLH